jgi:splicing factor 3B subunit 2
VQEPVGQPNVATSDAPSRPHEPEEQVRSQGASSQEDLSSREYNSHDFDFTDLAEFQTVFLRFRDVQQEANVRHAGGNKVIWEEDLDNIPAEDAEQAVPCKSKKTRKRETKLSVAELKAMAKKPELVEWTDADSSDPRLLLSIKSHRNVVPVPAHWSLKREVTYPTDCNIKLRGERHC